MAKNTIDTTYLKNSFIYSERLFNINPDSAMIELNRIEKECKDANYKEGLALCYAIKGRLMKQMGDLPEALEYMNKSLHLYQELNSKNGIAALKLSIGAVYVHISAYSLAQEYIHKSLEYYEKTDKHFELGNAYMTLSGIYIYIKEYKLGKEYIEKAIEHYEKINFKYGICGSKLNRAIILHEEKKYKECISEFDDVIELATEIKANFYLADSWIYVGSSYLKIGNHAKAKDYLFKVTEMKNVNSQLLLESFLYLGDLFASQENYQEAIKYAQKVVDESKKLMLTRNTMEAYERLAAYYSKVSNYKEAFDLQKMANALKDSIFDSEKTKQLQKLEAIYQTQKKQQQIEILENENQIQQLKLQKTNIKYVSAIALLLIISGGLILLIRNSRLKVKADNIKLEQKLLRTQMNPHFIFNAIAAIQHYIVKNRSLEASSYLSSFAKLMRSILQNSREEVVSLETEIQTIEDYLNLQRLRLDGNLEYKIQGKEELLDSEDFAIPPMLLQPFIENAIEHGIMKTQEQKGKIDISFKKEQKKLYIEIVDDGIGRENAKINKDNQHQSFATDITNQRIKSMRKAYKKEIHFNIIDLKNNENIPIGTKVIFELPLLSA
ncbi:MAG: histidine kinase [Thiohalospira sp.]